MKCSCGHSNPIGTFLCEYCGKPQGEMSKETIIQEMRYEGKARRSRSGSRHVLNKIWAFFSSVKVAIYLIVITLITAGIGTILPQERFIPSISPETYYVDQYGIWGRVYYTFGLSDMYNSWWFIALLVMIGVSLVVCSLDRIVPLYRALNNQTVKKDITFIEKQRIFFRREASQDVLFHLSEKMRKKSYTVRYDGNALLAEKGRLSRWGPYVNHIGLILFLVGLLCGYLPGWYLDEAVWVREGEVKSVPGTPYYVKNEKAFVEFYPNSSTVKNYQTNAVLYTKGGNAAEYLPVHRHNIKVNHPLKYKDLSLFQSDLTPAEVSGITFNIEKDHHVLGKFMIHLGHVVKDEDIFGKSGVHARILRYYPDFAFDEKHKIPFSRSINPNRPAFIFEVKDKDRIERSWVISGENFEKMNPKNVYRIKLAQLHFINKSGLMVRIDKKLPILFCGAVVTMIGLIMGFYWNHRRIWVYWEDGIVYVGSHTNKNWFVMQIELDTILSQTEIEM